MKRLRVLCDVDGVLADFVGLCIAWVAERTGLHYARESIDDWDHLAAMGLPGAWEDFRRDVMSRKLCRRMLPLPGARKFLLQLREHAEVKIATTPCTSEWIGQRSRWLEEFGVPLEEQIHLHDKADLAGSWDVLIDDKTENCIAFRNAGGLAFCIAAPYNANCPTHIPRGDHLSALAWVASVADSLGVGQN